MKKATIFTLLWVITLIFTTPVNAQDKEKFEINPGVDIVSSYVWRGMYLAGASIQPTVRLSYAGLSLEAWGSTDFNTDFKEFDLILTYQTSNLTFAIYDYWCSVEGARYGRYSTDHTFEGKIGYYFGESFPLNLSWSTYFAGGLKKENGDQDYATYIEALYDFEVKGVQLNAGIGVSPWNSYYGKGVSVPSISLKATKSIKLSQSFSLPLFGQIVVSPTNDDVFLVVGISL